MNLIRRSILPVAALCVTLPGTVPAVAGPSLGAPALSALASVVSAAARRIARPSYDTSVGNGVDANGRAALPLRAGAKRFYVNATTGSNSNTCTQAQSPSTPMATPKSAILCVTNGEGDQVLIAQGTSYPTGLYNLGPYGGFSAVYPTVVESYDPADPTNEAKLGASTGTTRPVITVPGTDLPGAFISGSGSNYWAVRGLKFDGGGVAGPFLLIGVSAGGSNNYTLFENNEFAGVQLGIQGPNTAYPSLNHFFVVRSNTFHGAWATDGHGQGLYVGETDGFTVEDNAFIHAGWKDGAAKTDAASIGGPSMFGHPVYSQYSSINGIYRRNYFGQSPDDSGELKGGGLYQGNLAIGNPIGGWYGDGDYYSEYRPYGVYADGGYNAIIGGGWCYITKNVNAVGLIHHNVCGNSNSALGTAYGLMSDDTADLSPNAISLPSYPTFDHNTLYSWGSSGNDHVSHLSSSGGLLADIHATHTNNLWGDPASGSNVNNGSSAFANLYTGDTLAQALGYANLATAEAAWQADPQLHGWRRGAALALIGYTLPDPGLVALTTNMALTAGEPISGQFIGTHDGSTLTFPGSLPTGVTASDLCRCWHSDGTGTTTSSGTFNVTETSTTGATRTTAIPWSISPRPVLSGVTVTPGNASATVAVSTNTGTGKLFYGYSSTVSASPTWAQLRSGVNADDSHATNNPFTSSQAVTATGAQATINLSTGLVNGTLEYFSIAQLDGNNHPSITTTVSFTPTSSLSLSSPTATATGTTTASLGVTATTGSGTLYSIASTSSTTPTATQIEAGNDSTGSTSAFHLSQTISASGVQSVSATGLAASTTYYPFFVQHTTADSNIVGGAAQAFTTSGSWSPTSLGSNLVADLTHLDSSHLFTDTGCSAALTTDLQTAKCIKDTATGASFTNSTGWVFHAGTKPYLTMDGTSIFVSTASLTYGDANGVWASWHTVNLSLSGLSELLDANGASSGNRILMAATQVPNTVTYVQASGSTLAQDNLSNSPLNTDAVFSRIMTGTSGSGTVEGFVNNVGDGSTAWTGTPLNSGSLYLSGTGKFYGALIAKGDQTANKASAQTYMAGLHP